MIESVGMCASCTLLAAIVAATVAFSLSLQVFVMYDTDGISVVSVMCDVFALVLAGNHSR